jgi:hypothetical protein
MMRFQAKPKGLVRKRALKQAWKGELASLIESIKLQNEQISAEIDSLKTVPMRKKRLQKRGRIRKVKTAIKKNKKKTLNVTGAKRRKR